MESSGSQDKKSVPKFSSFKPPPAPSESERPSRTERRHEHRSRSPRRSTDRARHRSPGHRLQEPTRHNHADYSSRDRRTSREHEINRDRRSRGDTGVDENQRHPSTAGDLAYDRSHLRNDELFVVDREGDRSVFKYGTAHRYDIPLYRRIGSGQVLGLPSNLVIDREEPERDIIIIRDKHTMSGKRKFSGPLSGPVKKTTQVFRLQKDARALSVEELDGDTISLDLPTERQSGDYADSDDFDDDRHAYRSIHGKAKIEDVLPQGMELISDKESQFDDRQVRIDEERRAHNADLWRTLASNPEDVATWLELIDHQNALILGPEDDRPLTSAERKSVADTKLSLYEKALAKCNGTVQRDILLLGRLQEGGQLWDRETLWDEWRKALDTNPESTGLQLKYMDLQQTEFQDFALDKCKSLLIDCMKRIDAGPNASRHAQVQSYLLLRLTLLLREAGYTELAVGFWQAALEFACFRPDAHLGGQRDTAILQFGEFWDSEVARLGELGGQGWRSDNNPMLNPVTRELGAHIDISSLFPSWASSERHRIQNLKMPARSLDNYGADVDTAYSVVLASDVREILPPFWHTAVSRDLVNAFLYFCHLPPLSRTSIAPTTRSWSGDNFLRNETMGTAQTQLSDWLPSETNGLQTSISPFSFPVTDFLHTTNTLFAPENWFYSLQSWRSAVVGKSHPLDTEWVRRTLQCLAGHFDQDDEFAEYALAVEFACDRKAAAEFAKRLLQTRRSSIKLYNTFALMRYRSGAHKAAFKAWSATINHASFSKLECGLLWSTWAWEMLEQGDFAKCSFLLYSIPQGEVDLTAFHAVTDSKEYSPLEELKLKRYLQQAAQQALANGQLHLYMAYTDCIALARYISDKSLLDGPLDTYVSAILNLGNLPPEQHKFKAFATELLHQARGRVIYFHVSQKRQFKPRQLEILLRESVSLFPHNTMFLALFMWNDSRFSMLDRIRDPMNLVKTKLRNPYELDAQPSVSPIIPQKTPVTIHLFSIYMALRRPTWAGGNVHYVRAAFEKALGEQWDSLRHGHGKNEVQTSSGDDSARSNITIWKLYVLFELDRAQDIKAAKAVFYRAIRACPWSKELVMLAFERLGSEENGMSFDELRGMYNILNEKELRLHVSIANELKEMTVQKAEAEVEAEAWLKALGREMEGVEMD
ncbi:hypothetical protein PEBR_19011 [Penicillium brasilianum]|uniref:DUF1740-domain-containing protein n=1 Tax=Penicillium brasilianum TaxID=104259 RepID=A0A1S9RNY2_PENBI|nr:hypothetical protein PEBR_19011 [Penicillium brasilianum]